MPLQRSDVVRIPVPWLAALLSLLIHAFALWGWHIRMPEAERPHGDTQQQLRLRIAPQPQTGAPPAPQRRAPAPGQASRTPPRERAPAIAQARPAPAPSPAPAPAREAPPPMLSTPAPAPLALAPPQPSTGFNVPPTQPAPPPAARAPAPPMGDFSAMLEARRRERNAQMGIETPTPQEDENARRNRIAAQNIAPPNAQVFGYDPRQTGGVFQIENMYSERAEVLFFGWNKDVRRRTAQRIEVRRGANPDIRIAIVRRMIAIIREHEDGDFSWYSNRLGRDITLSARPADNAGLENVLMREFFGS